MSILLKNITIDDALKDILIEGRTIKSISTAGTLTADGAEVMDCSMKTAIPGFINMHTHAAMSLMRGIGEDMVFADWLDKIWDIESRIDRDFIYLGSKVAAIEMIKSGTTTFNDQYWSFPCTRKAAAEMGIRAATGYDILDKSDRDEAARQKEQCELRYMEFKDIDDGGIYTLSFHAIYSVSEEMMVWAAEFARKHNLPLHIHLCETRKEVEDCKKVHGGLTPVEYLHELGVLGPNVLAAHTLWLTGHDIELLAEHRVNCIHNINSNTKLASGYRFLYNEMRDAGINLCIGTDGCASSNNLDILEAMKTAALFQKAWRDDPKALPLDELLAMATVNGAKALGINAGVIKEGALADISIVDTDNTYFLSPGTFKANLVYSAHSDCIDSLISSGRFVMKHRQIPDEKDILSEARKVLSEIS